MKTLQKSKIQTGIWLDGKKALIISFQNGEETLNDIHSGIEDKTHHHGQSKTGTFMGSHHVNDERKFEERKKHQTDVYLNEILEKVNASDELFIMGPSELKLHLKSKIEDDPHLRDKFKGMEAADYITTNQCVAKVKEFFAL